MRIRDYTNGITSSIDSLILLELDGENPKEGLMVLNEESSEKVRLRDLRINILLTVRTFVSNFELLIDDIDANDFKDNVENVCVSKKDYIEHIKNCMLEAVCGNMFQTVKKDVIVAKKDPNVHLRNGLLTHALGNIVTYDTIKDIESMHNSKERGER